MELKEVRGAAPLEFTDNVGMPLYEALTFAVKTLQVYGLSDQVKPIAAGKIITGFGYSWCLR